MIKERLPIADIIEGEIIVDFSSKLFEVKSGQWRVRHGKEKRITIETGYDGPNIDTRSNVSFIDLVDEIAKSESKSRSAWVMDIIEIYLEDNYQHLWHTWLEEKRKKK